MEVGCNDGILLNNFKKNKHLGIEPSRNVFNIAKKKGLKVLNRFFNRDLIKLKEVNKKYDIICGANVFCHIPDLAEMFFTLSKLLKNKGIISIEEPYLADMIHKTSYDQIYDEHIYMFSIISINKIASYFNLEVFDAEPQNTHGGSMRYYISQKNLRKKTKRFKLLLSKEKRLGLNNFKKLKMFNFKCENSKKILIKKIKNISKKYEIYGYGATSKSTTVLNYCRINNKQIKAIFDTSYTKINKVTPKNHIPIISYDKNFKKIKPKVCILFAWNHYKEICQKEMKGLKNGMKFLSHIDKKFFLNYKKYFI